ncbi:hypothetical protein PFICI_01358 [Pestalotiopsis fici W106-1]|uniref:Uncharacterized protein n=1 Tax=Pestalotiopsis fici (strain W106-1 / CGMCC3.15140) TaxID=1229662 RepID=W3XNK1_PESFW|nr:uncharacterized protein PFICI_01358 [Pestalotiopsis fici W106-1]ETS87530.1 hypothetical protein PFICI_01358 [Pestalotiopsis fici W106-1]
MSSKVEQLLSSAESQDIFKSPDLVKVTHKKPYGEVSPTRPELSQAGRTVLITGGNSGIGYAAALAFGQAGASRVIITGRRAEATTEAAAMLSSQVSSDGNNNTQFIGVTNDIADPAAIESLWNDLEARSISVDVLVLNAARFSEAQGLLERGIEAVWGDYNVNVRAQLHMAEKFYKQRAVATTGKTQKFLVMVSSAAIHLWAANDPYPSYGLTKNAGSLAMQLIAREADPEQMQIVSYHPGAVFTDAAKRAGAKEDTLDYTDVNLSGQFAVWAASKQANFLHGRYVWAEWDVNELKNLRERLEKDDNLLRIGVHGFE